MSNKHLGRYGEALALGHLTAQGYKILEKNFRTRQGEIDLIAQDGKVVCFVEVKTRQSDRQGAPYEAVHPLKVRKLTQMALLYLKYKYRSVEIPSRFDVISIIQKENGGISLQHLKNAFEAAY